MRMNDDLTSRKLDRDIASSMTRLVETIDFVEFRPNKSCRGLLRINLINDW